MKILGPHNRKILGAYNKFLRFFILFILLFLTFVLGGCHSAKVTPEVKAVDGVLDLTQWDFTRDGNVYLNGQWEFYWGELYLPENFVSGEKTLFSRRLIEIPSSWNSYQIEGQELGGVGFATFRLRVLLPDNETVKAIRVPAISTAHKLWVNGEILSSQGVVSRNLEQAVPKYYPQIFDLKQQKGELELILQVSNFNHRRGGVWQPFALGNSDKIHLVRDRQIISDMVLFGGLLIIGIYHLMFYALRRQDKSPLYFSLFCILAALRIFLVGEILMEPP